MPDPNALLLKADLKHLRLPTMLAEHDKLGREAAARDESYDAYLLRLTEPEVAARTANAIAARIRAAGFRELPAAFAQSPGDHEIHIDAGKVNTRDGWRDVKVAVEGVGVVAPPLSGRGGSVGVNRRVAVERAGGAGRSGSGTWPTGSWGAKRCWISTTRWNIWGKRAGRRWARRRWRGGWGGRRTGC